MQRSLDARSLLSGEGLDGRTVGLVTTVQCGVFGDMEDSMLGKKEKGRQ